MQAEKERVALVSIAASAGLTVAKAFVGFSTGSLAILSEAGHSLIDFGATVMTYVAVRISGKPADEEHHYGHGKVEAVSALAETALLFLLSGIVIWEAANRLLAHEGRAVDATIWAFGVILASIVIDFFRARADAYRGKDLEPCAGGRRAAFFVRLVVLIRGLDRPGWCPLWAEMGGFCGCPGGRCLGLCRRLAPGQTHDRHNHGCCSPGRGCEDHNHCRAYSGRGPG